MDKEKALQSALTQIEKAYGKGSVMRLGEKAGIEVDTLSTGSLSLDIALGVGAIAEAQKSGGSCVFIDAEHALDPVYAKKL